MITILSDKSFQKMAFKIIDYGSREYLQTVHLRFNILREPLGLDITQEELDKEKTDVIIGCFDDGVLEACCLLRKKSDVTVCLRHMAVLSGLQGKGIGRVLMTFAENIAQDLGYNKIIMDARKISVGFYEKLGYKICGNEFMKVTIPHIEMEKNLQAAGNILPS